MGTGASPCGELWNSKKLRFVQCEEEGGDAATVMAQLKLTAAKKRQSSLALFLGGFLAHNASVQSSVLEHPWWQTSTEPPASRLPGGFPGLATQAAPGLQAPRRSPTAPRACEGVFDRIRQRSQYRISPGMSLFMVGFKARRQELQHIWAAPTEALAEVPVDLGDVKSAFQQELRDLADKLPDFPTMADAPA